MDANGSLDFGEFCKLMATVRFSSGGSPHRTQLTWARLTVVISTTQADVGLSKSELEMLLSEADEDSNGNITYTEFVPLAVEVTTTSIGISPPTSFLHCCHGANAGDPDYASQGARRSERGSGVL